MTNVIFNFLYLSTLSGHNDFLSMFILDGMFRSCVSTMSSFSMIGLGLCFHDFSETGILKFLQMYQWIPLCILLYLCVYSCSDMSLYIPIRENDVFCFFRAEPTLVWLSQSWHLETIGGMSLILGIYHNSFFIPVQMTSYKPIQLDLLVYLLMGGKILPGMESFSSGYPQNDNDFLNDTLEALFTNKWGPHRNNSSTSQIISNMAGFSIQFELDWKPVMIHPVRITLCLYR